MVWLHMYLAQGLPNDTMTHVFLLTNKIVFGRTLNITFFSSDQYPLFPILRVFKFSSPISVIHCEFIVKLIE